MPTIAAIAHKTAVGQPVVYPNTQLGFAANFLHMMFATPCAPYVVNPGAWRNSAAISSQFGAIPRQPLHHICSARARARDDLHPPRRPRAEREHVDGADRVVVAGEPVRVHGGGDRVAVGPRPRRRQRGGATDAHRDRIGRRLGLEPMGLAALPPTRSPRTPLLPLLRSTRSPTFWRARRTRRTRRG